MPYKPKKPCKYPGCPRLTKKQYCDLHAYLEKDTYKRYNARYNANRTAEEKQRYHHGWNKIRDAFLEEHPACASCRAKGKLTRATLVHHIVPLSEGGTNDPDNLVSLCYKCHMEVHSMLGDRTRKRTYSY